MTTATAPALSGTAIRCTCCPERKKLAELRPLEGLEIVRPGKGRGCPAHSAEMSPKELLEGLAGTVGLHGVVEFVRRVMA